MPQPPPPLPQSEAVAASVEVDDGGLAALIAQVYHLSNEGVRLMQTQRAEEAEALLREALALAESKLGTEHSATAVCLANLGEFLSQNALYPEAENTLRRAVALEERLNGIDSASSATALNNLALVLRRTGQLDEAEPLYRRVLGMFEAALGPEHIRVAGVLNNLAQVVLKTGRLQEAEPLMRRAIGIFEAVFGTEHPNVAIALNNLARLLEEDGRLSEAEPLAGRHLRIFQIFENTTGDRHAYKDAATENYGALLLKMGLSRQAAQQRIDALLEGKDLEPLREVPSASSSNHALDTEPPDFDQLCRDAHALAAPFAAKERLYTAVFNLKQWHFIARGEVPNVNAYAASNRSILDGAPMLKAFTDTRRLHEFAKENQLTTPDGGVVMLSLQVHDIQSTLDGYHAQGVTHVHFNANHQSDGFYIPMEQVPVIFKKLRENGSL